MQIEARIIKKLQAGSEEAFDEIYQKCHKFVYYYICSYVKDRFLVEDIFQEAFMKMYNNIKTLQKPSAFSSWFIKIVKNTIFDTLKKSKNVVYDDEIIHTVPESNNRHQSMELNEVINKLPQQERDIIIYKTVFDFSFKEIAELIDINENTVKTLYYRTISKLKKMLKEDERYE